MTTTTLNRWGNSQGITIPKSMCDRLGLKVGDRVQLAPTDRGVEIIPAARYHRTRRVTIDELFQNWHGDYTPPTDLPTRGAEIDWGADQGAEEVR